MFGNSSEEKLDGAAAAGDGLNGLLAPFPNDRAAIVGDIEKRQTEVKASNVGGSVVVKVTHEPGGEVIMSVGSSIAGKTAGGGLSIYRSKKAQPVSAEDGAKSESNADSEAKGEDETETQAGDDAPDKKQRRKF